MTLSKKRVPLGRRRNLTLAPLLGNSSIMETVCGALLAAFFANAGLSSIDRSKLYVVPTSMVSRLSLPQRATAKACASHFGVKYVVMNDADYPADKR